MSQYRQWLHHRQVDLQLHTLQKHLVTELEHVQQQSLDTPPLSATNSVIQALTRYTTASTSQEPPATLPHTNGQTPPTQTIHASETISQALFDHSRLPDLETLLIADSVLPVLANQVMHTTTPTPSQAERTLLPESEEAMLYASQTEPQVVLPWWLHSAALSDTQGSTSSMSDAQNMRTNKLVQRWLERWGRQENQAPPSEKVNRQPSVEDTNI